MSSGGIDDAATMVGAVKYFPGKTTFGAKPSRLEWSPDDRIRLVTTDKKTGEDAETLFDAAVGDVRAKRFPTSPSMYTLRVGANKYKVDFAFSSNYLAGVSRSLAKRRVQESDLPAWVAAFEQAGILD